MQNVLIKTFHLWNEFARHSEDFGYILSARDREEVIQLVIEELELHHDWFRTYFRVWAGHFKALLQTTWVNTLIGNTLTQVMSLTAIAVDVAVGDGCDICFHSHHDWLILVGSKCKSLQKSTLIQKNHSVYFFIAWCIMCEICRISS